MLFSIRAIFGLPSLSPLFLFQTFRRWQIIVWYLMLFLSRSFRGESRSWAQGPHWNEVSELKGRSGCGRIACSLRSRSIFSICKTLVTSWHHLQRFPHHDLRKQAKNLIYSTRRHSNPVILKQLILLYLVIQLIWNQWFFFWFFSSQCLSIFVFHDSAQRHVRFADDESQSRSNNAFQQKNQMKIRWTVWKSTTNKIDQSWQRFQLRIFQKKTIFKTEIHWLMNNYFENFCDFSNHNGRSLQHQ